MSLNINYEDLEDGEEIELHELHELSAWQKFYFYQIK